MPLDLVDAEEEQKDPERRHRVHDEGVDERRNRAEPRPEIGDQLRDRHPGTEHERVLLAAGQCADRAEEPDADAGARPDDQRHERLALHVAHERVLHADEQRLRAWMRREALVERARQPR